MRRSRAISTNIQVIKYQGVGHGVIRLDLSLLTSQNMFDFLFSYLRENEGAGETNRQRHRERERERERESV